MIEKFWDEQEESIFPVVHFVAIVVDIGVTLLIWEFYDPKFGYLPLLLRGEEESTLLNKGRLLVLRGVILVPFAFEGASW